MSIAVGKSEAKNQSERFCRLPFSAIRLVSPLRVDLYCLNHGDREPRLLCGRKLDLPPEKLNEIEARGGSSLYVLGGDMDSVAAKLRDALQQVHADQKLALEEKFALLQLSHSTEIERLFRKIYCDQFIELAKTVGAEIAQLFADKNVSGPALFEQMFHNRSTHAHLTNVAAYLVVLAKELGVKDHAKLESIAIGGLLHEVGKLFVDQELYNKTGRLTARERIEIESSPQLGYEILVDRPEFEINQLLMVYQHHECFDGSGYPVAIVGDEICPWARMLAIVDVFDKLTSTRAQRRALECSDALLQITDGADRQFDPEMVLCWVSIFQQA